MHLENISNLLFSPDTRRPTRVTQSVTDFHHRTEKPLLPERPIGPLPPKPAMKPILLPSSEAARTATPSTKLPSPSQDGQAEVSETISLSQPQEKDPPTLPPRKETPPAPSPRRNLRTDIRERSERAQSVTEGLPLCQSSGDDGACRLWMASFYITRYSKLVLEV